MANNIKIVIVEDEKPIRDMYSLKLKSKGYNVESAEDGLSGFELINKFQPDLILLDLKMPKLPGNILLKKIREQPWGQNIKVIILTNISKSEAPPDLRFLGVDRYIVKVHYTPNQVLEIVNEVLES
jgi:DNA-binding response OmpR family regulator